MDVTHPELFALGVIVIGVIAARLASVATGFALGQLDKQTARVATTDDSVLTPGLIRIVRGIVFWIILTLSLVVALQVLGSGGFQEMIDSGVGFIPKILGALLIVVIGHLLGLVASTLLSNFRDGALAESPLPRLLHVVIIAVAVVIGLQQIRVDISFITRLLLIIFAVTGAGLALAFALGARQHVANLLSASELDSLAIGQRIRIDDIEGTVIEVGQTGVSLTTGDGFANVPASRFAESIVIHLDEPQQDG